jgi:ketosteroid isomerase-like protein
MKKHVTLSVLAVAGLSMLWTACTTAPAPAEAAPVDTAAINAEIQAMEDAYAKASLAKDADGVVAYYADDAISYMHDNVPVEGKEAIRARMVERMAKDTLNTTPTFKVLELYVGNDHITEIGSWSDADANGTVTDHGTYISIFKKSGDKWQCVRDMSVSATPKEAEEAVVAAE